MGKKILLNKLHVLEYYAFIYLKLYFRRILNVRKYIYKIKIIYWTYYIRYDFNFMYTYTYRGNKTGRFIEILKVFTSEW